MVHPPEPVTATLLMRDVFPDPATKWPLMVAMLLGRLVEVRVRVPAESSEPVKVMSWSGETQAPVPRRTAE